MDNISDETANRLIEEFEKGKKEINDSSKSLNECYFLVVNSIIYDLLSKYLELHYKYLNASFLTKWYYKMMVKKYFNKLNKFKI